MHARTLKRDRRTVILRATLLALACFVWLPGAASAQEVNVYQASSGFTSTQGANQWYYQYWNGTSYINMWWNAGAGYWEGSETYLIVYPVGQHPGSSFSSVRKWLAPRAGTVRVTGRVYKGAVGGDGVNAKVLHNTNLLFDQNIAYNDVTGPNVDLSVVVAPGDSLYFRVHKIGTSHYDSTTWDPRIEYLPAQWVASGTSTLYTSSNVGIGTSAPTQRLHVAGNINVTGAGTGTGNITVAGDVTANGSINAKYQDVAEWVPSKQKLSAGTVVVLDTRNSNHVLASLEAYDTRVAGVVSAQPGLILGEGGEGKVMVATTGRVRVRVDATRGPVRIGDLLVTSGSEGVAMKSEPLELGGRKMHSPGTIIGKALEPLEKGVGEILVLLSLQ
jgi:hypothetical protein